MMVKKYDRDKIEKQIFDNVRLGFTTSSEIARRMKMTHGTVSHFINVLVDSHQLYPSKIGRTIYYSIFAPEAPKAHDPFGLCHGQTNKSNAEIPPST